MFLAIRELVHGKWRFVLIGMILVLISWLVFIVSGLGNGLSALTGATFQNMDADYVVFEDGSRYSMSSSILSEELIEDLAASEAVENTAVMGSYAAIVLEEGEVADSAKIDVSVIGIEPGSFLEPSVIEGASLSQGDANQAIVNASLKEDGIEVGDRLEIEATEEVLEVIGFVEEESLNHLPAVFIAIDDWRSLYFDTPGSDMPAESSVNAIMLQGESIEREKLVNTIDGIEIATKNEAINGLPGYAAQNTSIMMMLGFLLVISAFVIGVFFYVLTLQKTHQFGVMKAIGASNAFLAKSIISQITILAVISIGIGILLTYITAASLPSGIPFSLEPLLVCFYAFILLIVSVLSSLISVSQITKIDPLQAMGKVE